MKEPEKEDIETLGELISELLLMELAIQNHVEKGENEVIERKLIEFKNTYSQIGSIITNNVKDFSKKISIPIPTLGTVTFNCAMEEYENVVTRIEQIVSLKRKT
ncbi:MAG: hypothetical protein OEY34_07375 [Cyclobacteriaceae bacterium]|nr:hypothetical protein [Cyclobacteriaceae bacterium]